MIPVNQAEVRLAAKLAELGFDAKQPDVALAVRAFRECAGESVDAAGDALLFQTGVFKSSGDPEFQLDFTRQFELDVDGEYEGMQQLHMTFFYAPTPTLAALRTELWSFDCASLDVFFTRVEAMPEYRTPLAEHQPVRFDLSQEEV